MEGVVTFQDFWRNRRVLVTGHTGFKGSWLTLMLKRLGASVTGYALQPTPPALFALAHVADVLTADVRADICDAAALGNTFDDFQPEIVIHLAAQPLVKAGYMDPLETYRVNVLGVAHVLEAARRRPGVRAILVITSDKCYDVTKDNNRHVETDRLGGRDPYSASKACAEIVSACFRAHPSDRESPLIVTARAGNVIGGGDFAPDRIVPDAIRALMSGSPLAVRKPTAVRPWQHVLEPLYGYLLLAEHTFRHGILGSWNFGPDVDDERTVEALVTQVIAAWGKPAAWKPDEASSPPETDTLRLDSRKAHADLGWRPILDFSATVEWTCSWYRAYAESQDLRDVTMAQIESYLTLRARHDSPPPSLDRAGPRS